LTTNAQTPLFTSGGFLGEPEAEQYKAVLQKSQQVYVSAASYPEAAIDHNRGLALDDILREINAEMIHVDQRMADIARKAYVRYGKGQHPAGLNYGDTLSYATSKSLNLPLLFKGNDFAQTDLNAVPLVVSE
jgi:ribonuclease VapC